MSNDVDTKTPAESGPSEVTEPSNEELRAFWDVPSVIALLVGADHRIRSANHGLATATSREHAALPGRTLKESMPSAGASIAAVVDRVIASGEPVDPARDRSRRRRGGHDVVGAPAGRVRGRQGGLRRRGPRAERDLRERPPRARESRAGQAMSSRYADATPHLDI